MVTLYLLNVKYFKLNSLNMDYNTVTEDIIRLTDDLNTWSSTLCIPVNDSDALLDNDGMYLPKTYLMNMQGL